MSTHGQGHRPGHGSSKIVLVGRRPQSAPPVSGTRRSELPGPRAGAGTRHRGWTVKRLTIAAGLGGTAVIAGGLLFKQDFGEFGKADSPLLAAGFGLFAVGMLAFCGSVIGLLGSGISALAQRRGWAGAALALLAPVALVWLLYAAGAVGYPVPAVLSLVVMAGVIVALK